MSLYSVCARVYESVQCVRAMLEDVGKFDASSCMALSKQLWLQRKANCSIAFKKSKFAVGR